MKIEELTDNDVIHIRNKKEAKGIVNLIGHPFKLKHIWGVNFGKNTAYFPQTHLIDDVRECAGLNIIPASKFLKPSLKKKVKELELKLTSISEQLFDLTKFNATTETNDIKGLEVHFDEVEKQPKTGWFKNHGALYFVENNTIKYGFDSDGGWKDVDGVITRGEQPATDEEVKEALVKEAERKYSKHCKIKNLDSGNTQTFLEVYECNINQNGEWYIVSRTPEREWAIIGNNSNPYIFFNGKWAEIISEPEIDFSKAGQLVESENEKVITTGWCNEKMFNGVDVKTGEFRIDWLIKMFTLCTEPVTLSN